LPEVNHWGYCPSLFISSQQSNKIISWGCTNSRMVPSLNICCRSRLLSREVFHIPTRSWQLSPDCESGVASLVTADHGSALSRAISCSHRIRGPVLPLLKPADHGSALSRAISCSHRFRDPVLPLLKPVDQEST
jgi:hypothetical protein